ncbi:MAG: DUF2017 family protein [Actinomycetota bacterium]|nr:DUF2017 domain-containing protein [Actinomycetota bacterium]
MRPFTRARNGRIELRLAPQETDVIRPLFSQMLDVLGADEQPDDLRRLFPPAYPDDDAAQQEFIHFTRDELLAAKKQALKTADATLERGRWKRGYLAVALNDEEQHAWLGALNDLRLFLGTRIGVTEDMFDDPADAEDPAGRLYLFLGWLQQHLVDALLG